MKKHALIFTALFGILFLFSNCVVAQDTIIKKSKEQIVAKVLEIGLYEIKYKDARNPDGPVIVISKSEVWKIKYENGTEFLITADPYEVGQEVNVRNKSNAIKFEFLSPTRHNLGFAYEHMLKIGMNIEIKIGIIGPGFTATMYENPSGVYFKAGLKFLTGTDYVVNGMHFLHQLRGFYVKPEIIYNEFSLTSTNYNYPYYAPTTQKVTYTNYAMNIVFGHQYILGNVMTFEWYGGIGFGGQTSSSTASSPFSESNFVSACYSHLYAGSNSGLVLSGGLTLGVLF